MRYKKSMLSVLCALGLLAAAAGAQAEGWCESGKAVKFAGLNWESGTLLTELMQFVLAKGYGCTTDSLPGNSITMEQALSTNDIQVFAEEWIGRSDAWNKAAAAGKVVGVGEPIVGAEKVQAADRCDGLKTFSEEKWAEAVRDELKQFLERYADDGDGEWFRHARVIWPEVKSLIRGGASNSYEAVDATQHFECDDADGEQVGSRIFEGFWERSVEEYSYRFIWCCRALVWAIAQYDAAKAPQAALEEAAQ